MQEGKNQVAGGSMTTNHTELCERLRNVRQDGMNDLVDAATDLIESQAARIADLENERDALRSCVKDALEQCVFNMATDEDPLADRMRAALQAEKETRS